MNLNNEDVNLSLAVGPTTCTIHTRLKSNSGAGVNTGSATDMALAATDHPLSELVWSPRNGLRLRCTNNSDKKPFLLWNVGPSGNDLSPSQESMRSNGDAVCREDLIISRTDGVLGDVAATLVGPSRSFRSGECDGGLNTRANGRSDCSKGDKTMSRLFSTEPVSRKLPEATFCSLPILKSPKKPDYEITSASTETNKNKTNTPLPIPALPLKKFESSTHRIVVCRGKGKEKASSRSDDESHTSVESRNSARLFSKKIIKRRIVDVDDDDQGPIHGGKRVKNMDSSFMKWISNMVKGLPDSTNTVKEDSSSALALTLAFPNNKEKKPDKGFQTIFQSLYCRNTDLSESDKGVRYENDNSCKQIVVCDKEVINPINISSTEEKTTPVKNTSLDSLWLTRFSTRTRRLEKCVGFTQETDVGPYEKLKGSTCSITCFFCGSGHDLRECPDVKVNELEDLVLKTSSFGDVEEFSCLCIRCFQLDHWAVSCPLAPSNGGSFISGRYSACHRQLSAGKRVSSSNASNLANNEKCDKKFPLCNIVTDKNKVAPSGIFHAIRNLRLSRSDILRWMDSNVFLSNLNGFFVRLRLGKMEKGTGATSYYVACLTGDARELNGCKSRKNILVDVGGIKSSVESRYVSNNDFLEDEIKAWWYRTVDSRCKIPSLDELNSKFNDRKSLGL